MKRVKPNRLPPFSLCQSEALGQGEGAVIAYQACLLYKVQATRKTGCSLLMTWWKHGEKSVAGGGLRFRTSELKLTCFYTANC